MTLRPVEVGAVIGRVPVSADRLVRITNHVILKAGVIPVGAIAPRNTTPLPVNTLVIIPSAAT